MKQSILIVAVAVAVATSTLWLQSIEYAQSTGKLIDTSTGESTERVARSGTVGETAPAGTLAGVTLPDRKAPPAITGDNIYVTWWTNETGNDEVMFRASTDAGETFGNSINLSNTTNADSTRAEIDSDADSVVVTWWETNQTDDTPVMRVSNDDGATFGPVLTLATNGTIGQAADEGEG
jgi:hypothetical protein